MDGDRLLKIVAKVRQLASAEIASLSHESVGVLQLYLRLHGEGRMPTSVSDAALAERIQALLAEWQAADAAPSASDQMLLDSILDKLRQARYGAVTAGEVAFLRATQEASRHRAASDPATSGLVDEIGALLQAYEGAQAADAAPTAPETPPHAEAPPQAPAQPSAAPPAPMPPEEAIPAPLSSQNGAGSSIDSATFFQGQPRRKVGFLDDIRTDLTVGVYEIEGDVTVEGDVPDEVLLVVRNGGATVNGMVFGSIVASGDIFVDGNVSGGWAVSKEGDIGLKAALANAHVLAKRGAVQSERIEGAGCIFGWNGLDVRGDVRGGRLLARAIQVSGAVRGAELHAVAGIRAKAIQAAPDARTVICLRDVISCEDFGRAVKEDERRLQRSIGKLRYDARVAEQVIRYAEREVRDAQRTMLYFLLGKKTDAQGVRTLRATQGQANLLGELVEAGRHLVAALAGVADGDEDSGENVALASECRKRIDVIVEDAEALAAGFDISNKGLIVKGCRDLGNLANRLSKGDMKGQDRRKENEELDLRCGEWSELRSGLLQKVESLVPHFGLDTQAVQAVEADPAGLDAMIKKTFSESRKRPGSEEEERANSSIMRLFQNAVDRHRRNIGKWKEDLAAAEKEAEGLRRTLSEHASFLFSERGGVAPFVRAGVFERGVELLANPVPGSDPRETAALSHVIEKETEGPAAFELAADAIRPAEAG